MKKLLLVFLSGLILLSTAACTSDNTLSFSLYATNDLTQGRTDTEKWYRFAEEYMGMKINIDEEILSSDNVERSCEEYIIRDDLADVFLLVESGGRNMAELAKQGKIINLLDYKDYMPNYSKILEENYNYEATNINGGIYGFATLNKYSSSVSSHSWLYNYTVFQKHNLSIPKDLEELYLTAKKLKELYPDSYPIMFNGNDLSSICECFGFLNRLYLRIDYNGSEYVMGLFENPAEWKDTVAYISRLYSEELIGPDFDSYSAELREYNASSEKVFIIPNAYGSNAGRLGSSSGFEWVCGNTPKGLGGAEPFYSANTSGNFLDTSWNYCISSEAENPELLVKLIDHDYSPEAIELYNWGEEGIHFNVDSNGERQLITNTKEEYEKILQENPTMQLLRRNQDLEFMMTKNNLYNPVPTVFNGIYERTDYRMFTQKYISDGNIFPGDSVAARFVTYGLTEEQNNSINENVAAVYIYCLREIRRFITGERSLNEWYDFIAEAKQQGDWKAALEIYNSKLNEIC